MRSQLQGAQRREAEQVAAESLENAVDLWQFGATLDDLIDPESGRVSPESVSAAVEGILLARPYLRRDARKISPDPDQGRKSGSAGPTWSDVLGR